MASTVTHQDVISRLLESDEPSITPLATGVHGFVLQG